MPNKRFTPTKVILAAMGLMAGLSLLAGSASAKTGLDGQALRGLIAGNTFSGQMVDGTPYRVFYDASGTARSEMGNGAWTVKSGQLCAKFEGNEQICLAGSLKDDEILWISPHGELEGTGHILKGNPFLY